MIMEILLDNRKEKPSIETPQRFRIGVQVRVDKGTEYFKCSIVIFFKVCEDRRVCHELLCLPKLTVYFQVSATYCPF